MIEITLLKILYLFLVIFFIIGAYAILRNLDIIKIILIYFKDKLLGGK